MERTAIIGQRWEYSWDNYYLIIEIIPNNSGRIIYSTEYSSGRGYEIGLTFDINEYLKDEYFQLLPGQDKPKDK